ncbi:hypothetical protein ESA94_11985 [Lacibacter luteus]|uniref:Uncharacterized protein n=1 Tax=Lacibacter luteus TaxID=2508719 RepID=A0A4V1M7G3_9BACT|nr:hypothetical protein [Lacibacter luteus]RXK59772.1 hypothetical protein ESA94_11985 [Lacibacter luteus]
MKKLILFLFALILLITAFPQQWQIKNYSAGYRVFEYGSKGNNPLTISNFLKDPDSYNNFLNNFPYNELTGNPSTTNLHSFYLNAEIGKQKGRTNFWKKHNIQFGLFLTEYDGRRTGTISNVTYQLNSDTSRIAYQYSITHRHQFLGINIGFNRRFTLAKNFQLLLGLHLQTGYTIRNRYKQQIDTLIYGTQIGWLQTTTKMPDLKGRKHFQTQAMIPIGFEYAFTKKKNYAVRLEFDFGIVDNRYRMKKFYDREAHGAGIWFIYKTNQ